MADDTISVALLAETGSFKTAMTEAADVAAKAGGKIADMGGKPGDPSALDKLVGQGGSSARELRMIAMELGSLGGAGTIAGRAMYGVIEATRALNEGLMTLGGAIGITTAAIGIAVTTYSYLVAAKRKAWQETATEIEMLDKLEKRQLTQQADAIARVGEMYKEQSATAQGIATMVRVAKLREDERLLRRSMTAENRASLEAMLKLMDRDIASILKTGKSITEVAKETSNTRSGLVRSELIDVDRLAKAHEQAAARSLKAWQDFAKGFSDTVADAMVNADFNVKKFSASLLKEAERLAARKAIGAIIGGLLAPLTGGGSLALNVLGGMGAPSLTQGLSNADARQGVK
mgnify:CR=1 FL=1